jgi:tetratricopeptide (TPR) repeat protein
MQPGQQSDSFLKFLAWLQTNQKRLLLWGTVIVLVAAAAIFFIYYQQQKEVRASRALSNVRVPQGLGAVVPPGTAEAYLKVAREHAGTKAGARALVLGAATLFTDAQYAEAQKSFEQFIRQYPESEWIAQAHFGIASSLDAQSRPAEAIAKFEEIRRRFANDPVIEEVKLALARLYEKQNRPDDAHKLYAELLQGSPYSGIGSEAGMRKAELEEKFPRLAQTNAPILTPPPLTTLTNRPPPTNRVINISNVTPRVTTNLPAPKPATNTPLILQPQLPSPQPPPPSTTQPGPAPSKP